MRNIRRIPISLEDADEFINAIKLLKDDNSDNDIYPVITEWHERIYFALAKCRFGCSVHNDHLYIESVMSEEGEQLDVDEFLSNVDLDALSDCIYDLFQCYIIYLMRKLSVLEQKEFIIKRFPATDVKYISFDMQIKELLKKGGKI
jgi:hypothetical protein